MIRDHSTLYIVKRLPGEYIKGIHTQGKITEVETINASVQPTDGNELTFLPEGERSKVRFTAYLAHNTVVSQFDTAQFNGSEYKIYTDQNWDTPSLYHNKLYLALIA